MVDVGLSSHARVDVCNYGGHVYASGAGWGEMGIRGFTDGWTARVCDAGHLSGKLRFRLSVVTDRKGLVMWLLCYADVHARNA